MMSLTSPMLASHRRSASGIDQPLQRGSQPPPLRGLVEQQKPDLLRGQPTRGGIVQRRPRSHWERCPLGDGLSEEKYLGTGGRQVDVLLAHR